MKHGYSRRLASQTHAFGIGDAVALSMGWLVAAPPLLLADYGAWRPEAWTGSLTRFGNAADRD